VGSGEGAGGSFLPRALKASAAFPAPRLRCAFSLLHPRDNGWKNPQRALPKPGPNGPELTTGFFSFSGLIRTAAFIAWAGARLLKIEMLLIRGGEWSPPPLAVN